MKFIHYMIQKGALLDSVDVKHEYGRELRRMVSEIDDIHLSKTETYKITLKYEDKEYFIIYKDYGNYMEVLSVYCEDKLLDLDTAYMNQLVTFCKGIIRSHSPHV